MDFKDAPSWKTVKMKDIAINNNGIVDGPFGSNLKTTDYINDSINGIPVLTTKNLNGDFSDKSVRYISKDKFDTLKRSAVFPGDILVAKIGSIGKCCIYPPDQRIALIPANLLKITLREEYYTKYVYYFIQSPDFQALIRSITKATAQPAFNVTRFRELPISVPCYTEQLKTVQKIEESLSQLDSAVETLKKTKQQLEVYRQAVLKEAFDISTVNQVALYGLCSNIVDCPHSTPKWTKEGKLCLRTTNFKRGYLDLSEKNYVSNETFDLRNKRLIPLPGDIVYSREGAILGIACIIPDNTYVCLGQRMMLLRTSEYLNNRFLMHYLNSPKVNSYIKEMTGGSASPHVNVKDIKALQIPVLPIYQQKQIIKTIDSKLSVCDSIGQAVTQLLQQAEALRQSILKQAFSLH